MTVHAMLTQQALRRLPSQGMMSAVYCTYQSQSQGTCRTDAKLMQSRCVCPWRGILPRWEAACLLKIADLLPGPGAQVAVHQLRHLVHLIRVVPRPVLLVRQLRTFTHNPSGAAITRAEKIIRTANALSCFVAFRIAASQSSRYCSKGMRASPGGERVQVPEVATDVPASFGTDRSVPS